MNFERILINENGSATFQFETLFGQMKLQSNGHRYTSYLLNETLNEYVLFDDWADIESTDSLEDIAKVIKRYVEYSEAEYVQDMNYKYGEKY
jgi:hypothetical protein